MVRTDHSVITWFGGMRTHLLSPQSSQSSMSSAELPSKYWNSVRFWARWLAKCSSDEHFLECTGNSDWNHGEVGSAAE